MFLSIFFVICSIFLVNCNNGFKLNNPGATLQTVETTIHCANDGVLKGSICQCKPQYSGKYCERIKNCYGYVRFTNGSCLQCQPGYEGSNCDNRICINGELASNGTCSCRAPYSGEFCDQLKTGDVYLYYNKLVFQYGPVGAFIIIPMILIRYGCSRLARKRQVRRVERSFEEQTKTDISPVAVENLLKQK
uniref:EGF-like domain-containing protein n=1 Tax=Panagrolaimus sp. JU765 TaxID=591449 RepID=A0AC34R2L1_9BILA